MSLLEDIFLQDEADEAQQLERVIDGDEFDDPPRAESPNSNENSEKEDEAEEDKRRVDPTKAKEKRVVKHPRFVLNPARLTGPRGIQVIPDHFKDFKFKGKGHEKADLDLVLKRLEHWAYRLYPKFQFEDCLKKIETLGKKRPVMVHLHKIRTDQFLSEETVVQKDSSDDEAPPPEEDEFDKLLQQQIEIARATPAPGSVRKGFETPGLDKTLRIPKATSSPSISEEQKERMIRNRKLAEERRLARLKQATDNPVADPQTDKQTKDIAEQITPSEEIGHKRNVSNVIYSSDDENVVTDKEVIIDIHNVLIENTEQDLDEKTSTMNEISHSDNNENQVTSSVDNVNEAGVLEVNTIDSNNENDASDQVETNKDIIVSKDSIEDLNLDKDVVDIPEHDDTRSNETNISHIDIGTVSAEIVKESNVIQNSSTNKDVQVIEDNVMTETQDDKSNEIVNIENDLDIMDVDFSDDF